MSRKPAPAWIARRGCEHHGLSAVERAVLLCLWDHVGQGDVSTVSRPNVAKETGFAVRSVAYAFNTLEERGFMTRAGVVNYGPGANGWSREVVSWVLTASPKAVKSDVVKPSTAA